MPKWKISKDKDIVKTLMKISEKICEDLFFMQQSRFMAIMNDYDRTLQLVSTSANSAGEANAQYAIFTDSLEAAQNRFNNSLEAFNIKLADSDLIKGFYEAMSGLLDISTQFGPLLTFLTIGLTALTLKHVAATVAVSANAMAQNALNVSQRAEIQGIPKMITGITKVIFGRQLQKIATDGVTVSENQAAAAGLYLNAVTGGILIALGALVGIVVWAVGAWSSYKEKLVESTQATIDQSKASKQEADSLTSLNKRYDELSSKVNLTTAEREELKSIKDEIAKIAPNLIESIDAEGNVRLKGVEAIKEELKAKRQLAMYNAKEALAAEAGLAKKTDWTDKETMSESQKAQFEVVEAAKANYMDVYGGFHELAVAGSKGAESSETIVIKQNEIFDNLQEGAITAGKAQEELKAITTYVTDGMNAHFELLKTVSDANEIQYFDDTIKIIEDTTGYFSVESEELRNAIISGEIDVQTALEEYMNPFGGKDTIITAATKNLEKSMSDSVSQFTRFAVQKINEEKLRTAGLVNDLILGMFETKKLSYGKNQVVSPEFEAVIANIGKSAVDSLQAMLDDPEIDPASELFLQADIDKDGILSYDEKMDYIKDHVQQKSEDLYNELIKQNPEAVTQVSKELGDLIDTNASQEAIDKKIAEIKKEYPDVGETIVSTIYDQKAAEEAAEKLANLIKPPDQAIEDVILGVKKLSGNLTSFITGLFDIGEADLGKKIYNELIADPEKLEIIEDSYANLDISSPSSVEAFKQTLMTTLLITKDQADLMFSNVYGSLDSFLIKTKETYDKIKKLSDDMKKSVSGSLSEVEAMQMMQEGQYGPGSIEYSAGSYFLTGEAIESERRKAVADLAKQHLDTLSVIDTEINTILASTDGISKEEAAQIALLEKQANITKKILDDVKNIDLVEKGRIENQSVLTGVSSINAMTDSLKSFGDVYSKITSGENLSIFDTLELIGNNPDLIGSLDFINGRLQISKDFLLQIAEAKKIETLNFLQGEKAKIDALIAVADFELERIDNVSKDQKELADQTLLEMSGETNATIETQNTVNDAILSEVKAIDVVAEQRRKAHLDFIEQKRKEIDAINEKIKSEGGEVLVDSTSVETDTSTYNPINIEEVKSNLRAENIVDKNLWQVLSDRYGLSFEEGNKEQQKKIREMLAKESEKLGSLWGEVNNASASALLNIASGSKNSSESVEELNDSLEKNYNLLRKIEDLESDIDMLQSRIDLRSTSAQEDLKYLKEKAVKMNSLITLQKQLISAKKTELLQMQAENELRYAGWVIIEAGNAVIVNQIALSNALGETVTQEFYDGLQKYVETYNDLSNSIRDSESAIVDLQAQQEEMYDEIINRAIETRQQLYDAIVEADQKELESAKEKFDQMTEMENEYLNAVKNAIDQERKAREDATKQEDLIAKKRRLATLQRDTSGLYATEAAKLQKEIVTSEQEARDKKVDDQLTALEQQMKVQQEQRDLQMQMLEEQQKAREETGYYWDRVDDAIQNGPKAMVDLLTSTQEYQSADPLVQQQQIDEMRANADKLAELSEGNTNNVVQNIETNARKIVDAIEDLDFNFEVNINGTTVDTNFSRRGGDGEPDSPGGPRGPGTGGPSIKDLQGVMNLMAGAIGFSRLKEDGIKGPLTKGAMDMFWDKMKSYAATYYGTSSGAYLAAIGSFDNAKSSKSIGGTALTEAVKLIKQFISPGIADRFKQLDGVRYKKGGLVDYTGSAWVDGTSSDPEAFLNAKQTEIFAQMRDSLEQSRSLALKTGQAGVSASTSIGDIIINLQNPVNASAEAVAALVKKDILNSIQNRVSMTIQNVR